MHVKLDAWLSLLRMHENGGMSTLAGRAGCALFPVVLRASPTVPL